LGCGAGNCLATASLFQYYNYRERNESSSGDNMLRFGRILGVDMMKSKIKESVCMMGYLLPLAADGIQLIFIFIYLALKYSLLIFLFYITVITKLNDNNTLLNDQKLPLVNIQLANFLDHDWSDGNKLYYLFSLI
jgi:hypothetical protein